MTSKNNFRNAEKIVSNFYNTIGWNLENKISEDARRWEDLRQNAAEYVSRCRLRLLRHIPAVGENIIDMASGPIQYGEYLEYSRNFKFRHCVDLSLPALELARTKIGEHGVYHHGSFFDLHFEDDYFDCAISLHTIYHMDKDMQEEAVLKLIRITKTGKNIIIIYSSQNTLISWPFRMVKKLYFMVILLFKLNIDKSEDDLYFYCHNIEWWSRYKDVAEVKIYPWRSFSTNAQKKLFPNNKIGAWLFSKLFNLEERFPRFFIKYFQYPMIVLTKK